MLFLLHNTYKVCKEISIVSGHKKILYDPRLKSIARQLRKQMTLGEVLFWQVVKNKIFLGYRFHRQKPIDGYIVDFFCNELMLAVEIDGITHDFKTREDRERQSHLERFGVRFLRFTEGDVRKNLDGVLIEIEKWIEINKK